MPPVRLWLCQVLTLCFVVRALIPAGYMPGFEGHAGAAAKLVICTAHGMKVITAPGDGADPERSPEQGGADCAFAGLTPLAGVTAPAPVAAPVHAPMTSIAFPVIAPRSPVRPTGPTSGSRAPPRVA